jgi:sucrose-phosphate synthase
MFILHIALQGCLRARNVDYGITADTGGHIKYLLELVEASEADDRINKIEIATRAFCDTKLGPEYAKEREPVSVKTSILRFFTNRSEYVAKEEMAEEVPAFTRNIIAYLRALPKMPDLVHAHYADAGTVARAIKKQLAIPYVFTAHSLGAVKLGAMEGYSPEGTKELKRRISIENAAVSDADAIIASSRDEAELQYRDYHGADPGKIRVIAPGSNLERFMEAAPAESVCHSIDRFLTDPDKPMVLAVARPVRKKNLGALIEAFGTSAKLREQANLVIVAGVRQDLSSLEGEYAEVWHELIAGIDKYDLYGSVAYPKTHEPDDVPAMYSLARHRFGVFVNPALNEPFGLTLLEASACGLPLVATDSGGPNDIIQHCANGLLVSPTDVKQLTKALIRMTSDRKLWNEFARRGTHAVEEFNWARHASVYHDLIEEITGIGKTVIPADPQSLLVCDIDNTLIGDKVSLQRFCSWRATEENMLFGIASGRSFHSAQAVLARESAPPPAFIIGSVGTSIYLYDGVKRQFCRDAAWDAHISQEWEPDRIRNLMEAERHFRPQSLLEQSQFKLSYFTDGEEDAEYLVANLLSRNRFTANIVISHEQFIDILPPRASKGTAVEYLRQKYALPAEAVIVAGDSGNDIEMLKCARNAIIVGNHTDGVASMPDLQHSYVAQATHAAGVLEGIEHFRRRHSQKN